MNDIIAFALRFSRVQALWDAFNGYKTYVGGAALMLLGAGKVLIGAAGLITQLQGCGSLAAAVEFARYLTASNLNVASISTGWASFAAGLAAVGLRHAQAKYAAAAPVPPQPKP